jgi:uncharacterized membrane protein YphA (DoxX/SURF4 family)
LKLAAKPLLIRLFEIILGALFGYAGFLKIFQPYEFAEAVLAYQLLPVAWVGAVAAILPWLEVMAGLALAAGLKKRSCLILLGFLAGAFLMVMLVTLARGLKIDCGCGLFFTRQVGLVPIIEDAAIFLWAAGLYYWELTAAGPAPAARF